MQLTWSQVPIIVDPEPRTAENGVKVGFPVKSQNKPVRVLPDTSCPLFEGDVFRSVIVKSPPVMLKRADAATATPPGPVPAPAKVIAAAPASSDAAASRPANT